MSVSNAFRNLWTGSNYNDWQLHQEACFCGGDQILFGEHDGSCHSADANQELVA